MSYNKYIIKRKKLSNLVTNTNDPELHMKLVKFIRMHPDHEIKRQNLAKATSTNPVDIVMHNDKINDLITSAEKVYQDRIEYKKVWDSEAETRKAKYEERKEAEKQAAIINKANKIKNIREGNLAHVNKQKEIGNAIHLERLNKKNQ